MSACDKNEDEYPYNMYDDSIPEAVQIVSGSADFSSYVSLGASNASGFMDNALFIAGQLNSFPNILAGAMSQAGGGEFTQPYVNDNVGGMLVGGQEFAGERFFFSTQSFTPQSASGTITTDALDFQPGPYSNMSFPFVRAITMVAPGVGDPSGLGVGTANPWFVRAASSPSATILGDVLAQTPSFVTLVPGDDFNLLYFTSAADGTGAYVDLGHNVRGNTILSANPLFSGFGNSLSGLNGSATSRRTYCTWSTHYEANGLSENNDNLGVSDGIDNDGDGTVDEAGEDLVDEGTDGLDNNSNSLVDENNEQETRPPYAYPLRGVEVRIRVYEPKSRQVRQVTVRHTFVPH